ncbi:MAG: Na+/H+ antiporter NhaC family protein [Planctomycetota bacterium]|nr:Na+/H+ antiporter NhaC family protein [Planctomycetota bacterium]
MNSWLSTALGALVGLALAAALLIPSADVRILASQGVRNLLGEHLPTDTSSQGLKDWMTAQDGNQSSLFSHVVRGTRGQSTDPSDLRAVGLRVEVDGQTTDEVSFRRAFSTRLSELNEALIQQKEAGLRIAKPGERVDVTVTLRVFTEGPSVSLSGIVTTGAASGNPRSIEIGKPPSNTDTADSARMPSRTSLIPPLVAILVALIFRRTLLALFLGILSGSIFLAHDAGLNWLPAMGSGFVDVFRVYLWKELIDTFRIEIIGFVILLVAMVGVMARSGGVTGLINLLLGFAKTVRSTLLVTWGMGMLIFFDDYANCLLVGNTMRPLTDRLRISREKLAYIVDSTAAPIAGISLLSTWIAYEVSTFSAHLPAAGIQEDAYEIFLRTIPYRYYCLFTLIFVGLTILTRRDYGPMRHAEARARTTGQLVRPGGTPMVSDEATRIEPRKGMPTHWWHAAFPITLVLLGTIASIFIEGGGLTVFAENPDALLTLSGLDSSKGITGILFDGSGGKPIFVGAFAGYILAMFLTGSNITRLAMVGGVAGAIWLQDSLAASLESFSWVQQTSVGELVMGSLHYIAYGLGFGAGALALGLLGMLLPRLFATRREYLPASDLSRASLSSIRALSFAVLILFQAWMIGTVCARMGTADYLVALMSGSVSAVMLPVLLFVAACLVAFSTGSSWSTMAILLPNVVALAASVGEAEGIGALSMVILCIGAVLEGSIFGDHCSPISDTTVLSSVSSASDHVDHVRTQAPYAVTTGLLAIGLGYIPTVAFDWWTTPAALGSGLVAMLLILFVFGRTAPSPPPDATGAPS